MKQGHTYEYVQCARCGRWVAIHWLVRHRKSRCMKGIKAALDAAGGQE